MKHSLPLSHRDLGLETVKAAMRRGSILPAGTGRNLVFILFTMSSKVGHDLVDDIRAGERNDKSRGAYL